MTNERNEDHFDIDGWEGGWKDSISGQSSCWQPSRLKT
jgi:hypothetical protein